MHTNSQGELLQKLIRSARRKAKEALRRGEEPPPCASLPYTD
jgi:hypothetical protein